MRSEKSSPTQYLSSFLQVVVDGYEISKLITPPAEEGSELNDRTAILHSLSRNY